MNKSQKYIVFKISVNSKDLKDELSLVAMNEFLADGVEEYSLIEEDVDDILGQRAYSGGDIPRDVIDEVNTMSVHYEKSLKVFYYKNDYEKNSKHLENYLTKKEISFEVSLEDWEDWNDKWRKHFKRISVSDNLCVVPSWEKKVIEKNEIYIYPGQGFGTGNHETTFLCLKAFEDFLDRLDTAGNCFDLGCGSGILGIAAIKKLKMNVDFCDVDKSALDNCLQNIDINFEDMNLKGTSLVLRDRFVLKKKYDLVFANILENVLILEKPLIMDSLKDGALLLISGILNHQKVTMIKEYSKLKLLKEYDQGDWSCLVFQK